VTPTTPAQKFSAGLAALTQGKDQQAATYFKELVAANPRDSNAEYNLGLAEAYLNEPAAAEAAYQRAIAIDPKMTSALYNLADLQEAHDPQLAIATLRRVLAIDPNNTSAQFNLGYWLEQRGKIAEGEALLGKAIAADPSLRSRVPAGIKLPASAG